jgi:hypothetical protein
MQEAKSAIDVHRKEAENSLKSVSNLKMINEQLQLKCSSLISLKDHIARETE